MLTAILVSIAAYLVGSIPTGYLLVRAVRRVDVRQYGSRNIGATNAFSVGGPGLGIATLLVDVGKAFAVVLLAASLVDSPGSIALAAFLALVGHAYSFWLFVRERRFSGGKSVASTLGVLLGLSWIGALPPHTAGGVLGVWFAGLFGPRLLLGRWPPISLATMSAAISLPAIVYAADPERAYLALALAAAALVLFRHGNNVKRLLAATEPRLDDRLTLGRATGAGEVVTRPRRDGV